MGNRIKVVICGLLYARLSDRDLIVDWSDPVYSDDGSNVFPRFFRGPALCAGDDLSSLVESINPAAWRGHLHESINQMGDRFRHLMPDARRALSIDLRRLDYGEQVVVLSGTNDEIEVLKQYHRGRLPDLDRLSRTQMIAKMLAEELLLTPEVRARIDNFKAEHFGGRTVGIHIRFSDYRANLLKLFRRLNALLDRERDWKVFVATDNEAILHLMRRHYPDVIATAHWFDPRGASLHNSGINHARAESAIAALTDLYLLAECGHLIVDVGSSFSFLASILSKATPDRIDLVQSRGKEPGILGKRTTRRIRKTINQLIFNTRALTWGLRALDAVVPIRKL